MNRLPGASLLGPPGGTEMLIAGPPTPPPGRSTSTWWPRFATRPLNFPRPDAAAELAVEAGADIITFHPRPDRRHIQGRGRRADEAACTADSISRQPSARTCSASSSASGPRGSASCPSDARRSPPKVGSTWPTVASEERLPAAAPQARVGASSGRCQPDRRQRQGRRSLIEATPALRQCVGLFRTQRMRVESSARGARLGRSLGLQTNAGHGRVYGTPDAPGPERAAAFAALPRYGAS